MKLSLLLSQKIWRSFVPFLFLLIQTALGYYSRSYYYYSESNITVEECVPFYGVSGSLGGIGLILFLVAFLICKNCREKRNLGCIVGVVAFAVVFGALLAVAVPGCLNPKQEEEEVVNSTVDCVAMYGTGGGLMGVGMLTCFIAMILKVKAKGGESPFGVLALIAVALGIAGLILVLVTVSGECAEDATIYAYGSYYYSNPTYGVSVEEQFPECPMPGPTFQKPCNETRTDLNALIIAGTLILTTGIALVFVVSTCSLKKDVRFFAGFGIFMVLGAGIALVSAFIAEASQCDTDSFCTFSTNICGGGWYCMSTKVQHEVALTTGGLVCNDTSAFSPSVFSGATLVPLSVYLLIMFNILYNRKDDHAILRKRWTALLVLVLIVGVALVLAGGLGLIDGCKMTQFSAFNPTSTSSSLAILLSCGTFGLIIASVSTSLKCGDARKSRSTPVAALSAAILVVAVVPASELALDLRARDLSHQAGFTLDACEATAQSAFLFTVVCTALMSAVLAIFLMVYQRSTGKQRHVQSVVVGVFIVSVVVTVAAGFFTLDTVILRCLNELDAYSGLVVQNETATASFTTMAPTVANSEEIGGVNYAVLPPAAADFDLEDERECSSFISELVGLAPMPSTGAYLESSSSAAAATGTGGETISSYYYYAYYDSGFLGTYEDYFYYYIQSGLAYYANIAAEPEGLYEPYCRGFIEGQNLQQQKAFRLSTMGVLENPCVQSDPETSRPTFFLKYRDGAGGSAEDQGKEVLFGWTTPRVRLMSGFGDTTTTTTTTALNTTTTTTTTTLNTTTTTTTTLNTTTTTTTTTLNTTTTTTLNTTTTTLNTTTTSTTTTTTIAPTTTEVGTTEVLESTPYTEREAYCRNELFGAWDPDLEYMPLTAAGMLCVSPSSENINEYRMMTALDALSWHVDFSPDNEYLSLVEAMDACARDCSCVGIVVAKDFDFEAAAYINGIIIFLLGVLILVCMWGCSLKPGRCSVPCCHIFLEEQDNVEHRKEAQSTMKAEVQRACLEIGDGIPVAFAGSDLPSLTSVLDKSTLTKDEATVDVAVFESWAALPPVTSEMQAVFFMTPKPGNDIMSVNTIDVSFGQATVDYPSEWPRHVKIARGICDALYLVSRAFYDSSRIVCTTNTTSDQARQALQPFFEPIDRLFQQAKWYYLSRRRRAFRALADLLVLTTLTNDYKALESGTTGAYEDIFQKFVAHANASVVRKGEEGVYNYVDDTQQLCRMLVSSAYRSASGQFGPDGKGHKRLIQVGHKHAYAQAPLGTSIVDVYLGAAMAVPYLQETLNSICAKFAVKVPTVAPIKNLWRIAEKAMSRTDGHAGEVVFVNDICRAQAVFKSIENLHNSLAALAMLPNVVIVRVKDRFTAPASGGWSDVMVNLFHTNEPTTHICEIQLCLENMLGVRQRLGGHADFNKFRGSAEVLEQCHYEHNLLSRSCKLTANAGRLSKGPSGFNLGSLLSSKPAKVTLLIPEGVMPGQSFRAKATNAEPDDPEYEAVCPEGFFAGMTVEIEPPSAGGMFSCGKKKKKKDKGGRNTKVVPARSPSAGGEASGSQKNAQVTLARIALTKTGLQDLSNMFPARPFQ